MKTVWAMIAVILLGGVLHARAQELDDDMFASLIASRQDPPLSTCEDSIGELIEKKYPLFATFLNATGLYGAYYMQCAASYSHPFAADTIYRNYTLFAPTDVARTIMVLAHSPCSTTCHHSS